MEAGGDRHPDQLLQAASVEFFHHAGTVDLDGAGRGSELVRDRALPFEWRTHREFLDRLAAAPLALNVAHLAGHGSIRLAVMGDRFEPARDGDVAAMGQWVREAMEAGCIGLSTGLGYAPGMFASPSELTALAAIAAEYGALFTSHVRAYSWISPFFSLNHCAGARTTCERSTRSSRSAAGPGRDCRSRT